MSTLTPILPSQKLASTKPQPVVEFIYTIEITCAHCAALIEAELAKLPQIHTVSLALMTKQLRIQPATKISEAAMLDIVRSIADRIEPGTVVESKHPLSELTYYIDITCAHCASLIETEIAQLPTVSSANIILPTKQLRISSTATSQELLPELRRIADKIEPGTVISESTTNADNNMAKKNSFLPLNIDIAGLVVGSGLFIVAEFLDLPPLLTTTLFVLAYLILGWKVLSTAILNMGRGRFFDENFLMSIATLGAFTVGDHAEAVGVILFFRLGEAFESYATNRSRSQIMAAVDMRPETVNLLEADGNTTVIPAQQVKAGDTLRVYAGERIPLDSTVISGKSRLDTSPITGESLPVEVNAGDTVISGCVNLQGSLTLRADKPLAESMVSRILSAVENAAANKPAIDRFITKFARVYTPIVIAIAIATAIVPGVITGDWRYWIYTALTFLVISCPCALVISVPLAFFSGIGLGSKYGILFKGGSALESLTKIKVVAFDKTGTITYGNFAVTHIEPADKFTSDELLTLCASCEQQSTHPIAGSIVAAATQRQLSLSTPAEVTEYPGEGIVAQLNGQRILCGNEDLLAHFNINVPEKHTTIQTVVYLAVDNSFSGSIYIGDTIKDEAANTIKALKQQNLFTALLTGDNPLSAQYVADKLGINKVVAKLLPEGKLDCLRKLRRHYGPTMFVGDGINDAPILAGADIGIAMGSGSDAAIEAADVVIMNSQLTSLIQARKLAKATLNIAIQNVIIAIAIKLIVMLFGLAGYASMWAAVFADSGVALLCILNAVRIFTKKL